MLTETMKEDALRFFRTAGEGRISLKFCERFDERSKIWNFKEHSHTYLEIIYFLEGKASVVLGEDKLDVASFDLLLYPPEVKHRELFDFSNRQEIVCFWLELDSSASLPFPFKLADDEGELGWLCRNIHTNHLWKRDRFLEIEEHLIRSLLLFIEQKLGSAGSSRNAALDRSRAYIDEHCAEDLDMDKLARVACVSSSYLSRLFKRSLGTTPMRYRNTARIEKAKHLLLMKSVYVEEIADALGFEDPKHFSQLFKSLTSLTPSQFRKKFRVPE